jgi:hypothetical protein
MRGPLATFLMKTSFVEFLSDGWVNHGERAAKREGVWLIDSHRTALPFATATKSVELGWIDSSSKTRLSTLRGTSGFSFPAFTWILFIQLNLQLKCSQFFMFDA